MPWPEHTQLQCHRRGHRHGQQDHVPAQMPGVGRAAEQAGGLRTGKGARHAEQPGRREAWILETEVRRVHVAALNRPTFPRRTSSVIRQHTNCWRGTWKQPL